MRKQFFAFLMSITVALTGIGTVALLSNETVEAQAAGTTVTLDGFRFKIPDGYTYSSENDCYTRQDGSGMVEVDLRQTDSGNTALVQSNAGQFFTQFEEYLKTNTNCVLTSVPETFDKKTVAGKTAFIKDYRATINGNDDSLRAYFMQNTKARLVVALVWSVPAGHDYTDEASIIESATIKQPKYISESKLIKYVKKHQYQEFTSGKEKYVKIKVKGVRANKGIYKTDKNSAYVISTKGRQYFITRQGKAGKIKKGQTLKLKVYSLGSANGVSTMANAFIGF